MQAPVQLRPHRAGHLMNVTMAGLIMQILDHLKAELILHMKMNALGVHRCGRKVHGIGSFIQQFPR
jgi:hypothetical protein